jgi:hypothetical protein
MGYYLNLAKSVPTRRSETQRGEWPTGCLASRAKFSQPHAHLFPLLGKRVLTPMGTGKLEQVFARECAVKLDGEGGLVRVPPDEVSLIS